MPAEKYLCHNPFEGEGSITNENGPKRRAQRTVHRQECDGVFCARNGLIGDYNPLWHVETLDGSPLSVAFAVHPNLPIVVDARLKQDSYTINRVPFHRFGQRDFDAIPSEGEPTGYPLRQVRGYLPAGIIVVRQPRRTTVGLFHQPSLGCPGTYPRANFHWLLVAACPAASPKDRVALAILISLCPYVQKYRYFGCLNEVPTKRHYNQKGLRDCL